MRLAPCLLALISLPLAALEIGDRAPGLDPVTWIKGAAPTYADQVTVVEFWATWCGPCLTTIPHLTKLNARHGERLAVVGISAEDVATATPFVTEQGEKMEYNVGVLGRQDYQRWMAGVRGIPHAFIVGTDGTVLWKGHPMGMDATLARILAGNFNPAAAAALAQAKKAMENSFQSNDMKKIQVAAENVLSLDPADADALRVIKILAERGDKPGLYRTVVSAVDPTTLDADTARRLAVVLLGNQDPDFLLPDLALALCERAEDQAPEDSPAARSAILGTAAQLRYRLCDIDGAISKAETALELAPEDGDLQADLAFYRRIKELKERE